MFTKLKDTGLNNNCLDPQLLSSSSLMMLLAGHISVDNENTYREDLKKLAPLPPTKQHRRAVFLQAHNLQGPDPQKDPVQEGQAVFASSIWGSWGSLECPYRSWWPFTASLFPTFASHPLVVGMNATPTSGFYLRRTWTSDRNALRNGLQQPHRPQTCVLSWMNCWDESAMDAVLCSEDGYTSGRLHWGNALAHM